MPLLGGGRPRVIDDDLPTFAVALKGKSARTAGEIGSFKPYGGKIEGDIAEPDQAHAEP
ncbi:hypothetical protein ACFWBH_01195 [Streptomyces sp. NPDC059999]|uniref:hypothetical protein n=1 Tax=Streptomyces sp. NPDC059999 TaxID=3347030 RepID=UPI0036A8FD22